MSKRTRRRAPVRTARRRVALMAVGALAALAAAAPFAASGSGQAATSIYIVQLAGAPAAAYGGGVAGLPATRPAHGHKLNARSTAVRDYRAHLRSQHAALAA